MEVVRSDVGGVPAFWAFGPGFTGRCQAGLVFRVGRADETLARGGITHLVEHLVLHPLGLTDYHYNGSTGSLITTFYTESEPAELSGFLAQVCTGLRALPVERLSMERQILRTEADGRARSLAEPLRQWRYGPVGYGLPAYGEFGLDDLTADDLRDWVASWFTRGNAALWVMGGPPPADLRLDLPDGPRMAVPPPSSALPRTPAYFTQEANGVAFDAVVTRGVPAQAYATLLGRRLHETLRTRLGLSYQTQATCEPRDATAAMITAGADALASKRSELVGPFVDVLVDLAVKDVTDEELKSVRASIEPSLHGEAAALAQLHAAAMNHLIGAPRRTPEDIRAELAGLGAADYQRVAREALDTGLAMVPPGQAVGRAGFTQAPTFSADRVQGSEYPLVNRPDERQRIVLADDGVSITSGPNAITVRYADCAGMLAFPDGARVLFAPDAVTVHIEPNLWSLPPNALAFIDRAVPPDRVARPPARDANDIPQPPPAPMPVAGGKPGPAIDQRRRSNRRYQLTLLALLALTVVTVVRAALGDVRLIPVVAIILSVMVLVRQRWNRSTRE